jgi:hypothetical protein
MKRIAIWVGMLVLMAMLLTSCAFYGGGYSSHGNHGYYAGYGYYGAPYGHGYYGHYNRGNHGRSGHHYYRR